MISYPDIGGLGLALRQSFITFWITKCSTKPAFRVVNPTVPCFTIPGWHLSPLTLINSLYINLCSNSLSTPCPSNAWCWHRFGQVVRPYLLSSLPFYKGAYPTYPYQRTKLIIPFGMKLTTYILYPLLVNLLAGN